VPVLQARGRGNIVVHVHVEVPGKLNKRQRELMEEMDKVTSVEGQAGKKSLLHKVRDIFQ
jgi:molecular chaperone DnaJ